MQNFLNREEFGIVKKYPNCILISYDISKISDVDKSGNFNNFTLKAEFKRFEIGYSCLVIRTTMSLEQFLDYLWQENYSDSSKLMFEKNKKDNIFCVDLHNGNCGGLLKNDLNPNLLPHFVISKWQSSS